MREWLSRDAWAAAIAKGEAPDAGLRKAYIAEVEKVVDAAGPRATYRFTLSTATPDRERDTIAVDGWKLKNYRANPVVLWAHDYRTPPVGQAVELPKVREDRLVSGVRFDSDVHDLARIVEQLVDRGTLRATSVGFAPLKHQMNDERRGYDFLEQELLEWSIVPVPANPEALAEAKSAGLDLAPIRRWAEQALEAEHGPGFWIARATLEATWRIAGRPVTYVLPSAPHGTITVSAGGTNQAPVEASSCPMGQQCPRDATGGHGTGCSMGASCPMRSAAAHEPVVAKAVPGNASTDRADEGTAWSAPSLQDFTDKAWGDLSAAEKNAIARHYAWAKALPPATFGDLKLPHHEPSGGKVVWRGVAAAMAVLLGGRGGVDIPSSERRAVYNHLAAHYRAFGKEPPPFKALEADDLPEVADADGGVRFYLDGDDGDGNVARAILEDPDLTEADVRAVFAELAAQAAQQAMCRLTGRVD